MKCQPQGGCYSPTCWSARSLPPLLLNPFRAGENPGCPRRWPPQRRFRLLHQSRASLQRLWGIDDIHVRSTASGSLIRFSYRVVDADKAKILNDKKAPPYLIDEKNGLALPIPQLENVGQLRQVATPQNGREYWMAFSNKGRYVKPGDHVTLVIGRFRAQELVVEGSSLPQPH